jgi:hypothetical protein
VGRGGANVFLKVFPSGLKLGVGRASEEREAGREGGRWMGARGERASGVRGDGAGWQTKTVNEENIKFEHLCLTGLHNLQSLFYGGCVAKTQ